MREVVQGRSLAAVQENNPELSAESGEVRLERTAKIEPGQELLAETRKIRMAIAVCEKYPVNQ